MSMHVHVQEVHTSISSVYNNYYDDIVIDIKF